MRTLVYWLLAVVLLVVFLVLYLEPEYTLLACSCGILTCAVAMVHFLAGEDKHE